jgi:hypothetical protein
MSFDDEGNPIKVDSDIGPATLSLNPRGPTVHVIFQAKNIINTDKTNTTTNPKHILGGILCVEITIRN